MTTAKPSAANPETRGRIPATIFERGAFVFWFSVLLTGIGAGLAAAFLTKLLEVAQKIAWGGNGRNLLQVASQAGALKRVGILLGAGLLTGLGQLVLTQLTSGNGTDITEAIWFRAGRLPALRTLGSALLSVLIVGFGVSLGREGAPKQSGAVFANWCSDFHRLTDEERKLLVACGAGAGMAAAYGVPLGGALFALEVLRGVLALRLILPALLTAVVATLVSWLFLPAEVVYQIPNFAVGPEIYFWALLTGPILGVLSVGYVRLIALSEKSRPRGWRRFVMPLLGLGFVGVVSVWFPQVLGNGKDTAQQLLLGPLPLLTVIGVLVMKPICTSVSLGCGAPGGLFTPSLSFGALAGAALGLPALAFCPSLPSGLFALLGAGAMLAATTQGPISAMVLVIELTGHHQSFLAPMILIVTLATLVARSLEPRSIYDAKLSDDEVRERMAKRLPS